MRAAQAADASRVAGVVDGGPATNATILSLALQERTD
jgi:hypothetical protein